MLSLLKGQQNQRARKDCSSEEFFLFSFLPLGLSCSLYFYALFKMEHPTFHTARDIDNGKLHMWYLTNVHNDAFRVPCELKNFFHTSLTKSIHIFAPIIFSH